MGTNLGWVVGWADWAVLAGAAGKPRRTSEREIRFALVCLPARHTGGRGSIPAWIRTTNLTRY
jgi:hypothetical protein